MNISYKWIGFTSFLKWAKKFSQVISSFTGTSEYLNPKFFENLGLTENDKKQFAEREWRDYTKFEDITPGTVIEFYQFSVRRQKLCGDHSNGFLALPTRFEKYIWYLDRLNEEFRRNRIFLIYGGKGNENIGGKSDAHDWHLYFDLMVVPKNRGMYCFVKFSLMLSFSIILLLYVYLLLQTRLEKKYLYFSKI